MQVAPLGLQANRAYLYGFSWYDLVHSLHSSVDDAILGFYCEVILIYAFDQINLFAKLTSVNKKLKHTESRKQELLCLGLESLSQDFDSAVAHNSLSLSLSFTN